jgi:hypothetical protein
MLEKTLQLHAAHDDKTIASVEEWCRIASAQFSRQGSHLVTIEHQWPEIWSGAFATMFSVTLYAVMRTLESARSTAITSIRRDLTKLAVIYLIKALDLARPLASAGIDNKHPQTTNEENNASSKPTVATARENFKVLDNIATYHREHERYYTVYSLEAAVDLARDSNRLKILADVWLSDEVKEPKYGDTDFRQPGFEPAGCDDLNSISTIASIGILFMEGQAEPAEIRQLKGKLAARSGAATQSGKWLADRMVDAWPRESVLISDRTIDAVVPRFQTIATNWTGSNGMVLIGRLLALANASLAKIDFTPAAVRANRKLYGNHLLGAARILEMAMRLQGKAGLDLSGNDVCWTEYRAQIAPLVAKSK